jgi:branched-chain amino acid transport system permease protein
MSDRSGYAREVSLLGSRRSRIRCAVMLVALVGLPFVTTPFQLDLANQVLLASIGSLALMLLTGFAGLISLGTAGLLAAGAYAVGVLVREIGAPFWVTLPAAAALGACLGLVFGLPSLRLRGLYLAISTLGLHFVVVYLGGEYEARATLSTGIMIDSPSIAGWTLSSGRAWYFVLLAFSALALLISLNLQRTRTGRAWRALRERDVVAGALGIDVQRFKLMAFVVSATMTAVAGALFAYFRNFVSIDAFSLYLTVQYVAMIIIGGMGSIPGALLGAGFVILFPYAIEAIAAHLPARFGNMVFAFDYAAFGVVMILFLLLEPAGLMGILRRIGNLLLARRAAGASAPQSKSAL